MTTLATAVQIRDRQINVDTASTTEMPFLFQIDSEVMRCIGGGGTLFWDVARHENSSRSASHAASAAITEVQTPIVTAAVAATAVTPNTAATTPPNFKGGVMTAELAFAENGAGVYVGTVVIPAGATVLDVIVRNTAVWAAGTSAALVVGDDDIANGYIASTNVKTTPAADTSGGEAGLSTRLSLGATAGVYKGGGGKFCATSKTITATITSVGAGTTGRTRVLVEYALPSSVAVTQ